MKSLFNYDFALLLLFRTFNAKDGSINRAAFWRATMSYFPRPTFETRVVHFSARPSGPRLVESPNSRMVVAVAPWAEIRELLSKLGTMKVAAYLLAGAAFPEGIVARLYIGETTDLPDRMRRHASDPQKRFVSEAYIIGSYDRAYGKWEVQCLQYHLDRRVEEVDRALIVRGAKPALPKDDTFNSGRTERDFEDVRRLLPSAGCHLLESRNSEVAREPVDPIEFRASGSISRDGGSDRPAYLAGRGADQSKARAYHPPTGERRIQLQGPVGEQRGISPSLFVLNHAGFVAYGYQHDAEFVVLPGSQVRRSPMKSFEDDSANMQRRNDIISANVLVKIKGFGDRWRLTRERRFPSRSIAAKCLMGVNLKNDAWLPVTADNQVT
jgi:hypothetical protein